MLLNEKKKRIRWNTLRFPTLSTPPALLTTVISRVIWPWPHLCKDTDEHSEQQSPVSTIPRNAAWPALTSPFAKGDDGSDQDVLAHRDSTCWRELLLRSTTRSHGHIPSDTLPRWPTRLIFPPLRIPPCVPGSPWGLGVTASPRGGGQRVAVVKSIHLGQQSCSAQSFTERAEGRWCLTTRREGALPLLRTFHFYFTFHVTLMICIYLLMVSH